MKLIDVVRLTREDEKIALVIKGVETSETKSMTPQLLAMYSEQAVGHITVGVDALEITVNKMPKFDPPIDLHRYYTSCPT